VVALFSSIDESSAGENTPASRQIDPGGHAVASPTDQAHRPDTRLALGLMSGTSLDGIDAALVWTDGQVIDRTGAAITIPYEPALRQDLRGILGGTGPVAAVERALTEAHAGAVHRLLSEARLAPADVAVIGFHGHTILHRPNEGRTWQIGDGALLARLTGIDVVCDLRANDVAHGGQGAPLVPLYHAALCGGLERPIVVLNIGGVANLTWIGAGPDEAVAFDTGPGNALLDEWTERSTGQRYDSGGKLASAGRVDPDRLARLLRDAYFDVPPPKSLDRIDFGLAPLAGLSAADGAATLAAFTCAAVERATRFLPAPPRRWLVTGGGRHNPALMGRLAAALGAPVLPVEAEGWDGDALEAQAFAFLAVRSLQGLPLTIPATTGVSAPVTGGRLFLAPAR
jgi:anhydro-N-acetylmuramic acid kinase